MRKFFQFLSILFLLYPVLACSGIQDKHATFYLYEGISISKVNLFVDHYGGQHIVGVIRNDTAFPARFILLNISLAGTDGESVLRNSKSETIPVDLFQPFLTILFPGESSGFDYSLSPLMGTVTDYHITFSSAIKADVEKADVRIENAQIQSSMYGTSFLMGEIVNHDSQPARIEGLGVAVFGDNDLMLDTNDASNIVKYLAPMQDPDGLDRETFAIPLRGTFRNDIKWEPFLSSVVTHKRDIPGIFVMDSLHYMDAFGYFHLIGWIGNKGTSPLSFPLIASLLDEEGIVLDSIEGYLPVDLPAGSVAGVDLVDWHVVNHNPGLQRAITKTRIQIDPSRAFISKKRYRQLIPSEIQESRNDLGVWTFQGRVNNLWSEPYQNIAVVISIYSENKHLAATNYQWIHPINPLVTLGRTAQFDLQVFLDPSWDTSRFTYQIQLIGESSGWLDH